MTSRRTRSFLLLAAAAIALPVVAADIPDPLPDPDGKPADMSKPVQVYILLGQSNMVGAGRIAGDKDGSLEHAVKTKQKYPYLVDDAGNWTVRMDVPLSMGGASNGHYGGNAETYMNVG